MAMEKSRRVNLSPGAILCSFSSSREKGAFMDEKKIIECVPEVYHGFLPPLFQKTVPRETAATCDDCAMWADNRDDSATIVFSRETKCCTHFPEIPNYLAGALLASEIPAMDEGRKRMRALIASGTSARPHGIVRTAKWNALIRLSRESFGRSRALRCPLYNHENGSCSIRPFWDAVCSSWFCKYTAGYYGREFWLAFRAYFTYVQNTLVSHALFVLGYNPSVILEEHGKKNTIPLDDMDDQPLESTVYRKLWGEWAGREGELYREAYSVTAALSPDEFERIAGVTERLLRERMEEARRNLVGPVMPDCLKRNPDIRITGAEEDDLIVSAYSPFDPVKLSRRLVRILDYFDGKRTTGEVRAELLCRGEAIPSGEILLMLYQFRLLIPAQG